MSSTPKFIEGMARQKGREGRLRQKLAANRERNWFLALTLNSFAKLDAKAPLTDMEQIVVDAFRQQGFTEAELQEQGRLYQQMSEPLRREIFPTEFASLTAQTQYGLNNLKADLPGLETAVLGMQNVTDVDTTAIAAGRATASEFPLVSRQVLAAHSAGLLRVVAPNLTIASSGLYTIKATKFRCNDETGRDWTGSDEPYWIFASLGAEKPVTTRSPIFGDVDTGESRNFAAGDGCLWGQDCTAQNLPDGEIGIHIQLWEHDSGNPDKVRSGVAAAFTAAAGILAATGVAAWVGAITAGVGAVVQWLLGYLNDDHIADQTFVFTRQFVESRLTQAGQGFDLSRRFTDGDGNYTLTLRINRVA